MSGSKPVPPGTPPPSPPPGGPTGPTPPAPGPTGSADDAIFAAVDELDADLETPARRDGRLPAGAPVVAAQGGPVQNAPAVSGWGGGRAEGALGAATFSLPVPPPLVFGEGVHRLVGTVGPEGPFPGSPPGPPPDPGPPPPSGVASVAACGVADGDPAAAGRGPAVRRPAAFAEAVVVRRAARFDHLFDVLPALLLFAVLLGGPARLVIEVASS